MFGGANRTGGLIGSVEMNIGMSNIITTKNSTSSASIYANGYAGGDLGSINDNANDPGYSNSLFITNTHTSGLMSSPSGGIIGGLIGSYSAITDHNITISKSSSSVAVTGNYEIGGFIGRIECPNAGSNVDMLIEKSYSAGGVTATFNVVGGFSPDTCRVHQSGHFRRLGFYYDLV